MKSYFTKEIYQFYMSSIEYFGVIFSAQGMSPDPRKGDAIKNAEAPTSVSDVSDTHKGVDFIWKDAHQRALDQLKLMLSSHCRFLSKDFCL